MNSGKRDPKNASTALAFVGLIFVVGGLLAFTALLVPFFAIVVVGFSLVVFLQYLAWGWWFPKIRRRDDGDD